MLGILFLGLLSMFLFLVFLILLTAGLIIKKQKLVKSSLAIGGVALVIFCYAAYMGITESYKRTGNEIYAALFPGESFNCVKVISTKDAEIPIIDNDIRIHFKCCPEEMKRILKLEEYTIQKEATANMTVEFSFNPQTLGDTILTYQYSKGGGGRQIYSRLDMTEGFCVDFDF